MKGSYCVGEVGLQANNNEINTRFGNGQQLQIEDSSSKRKQDDDSMQPPAKRKAGDDDSAAPKAAASRAPNRNAGDVTDEQMEKYRLDRQQYEDRKLFKVCTSLSKLLMMYRDSFARTARR